MPAIRCRSDWANEEEDASELAGRGSRSHSEAEASRHGGEDHPSVG